MLTELRYERWFLPLSVPLGLGPKKSEVRIADGTLHVKMGWGFEAHIPIASITRAEATEERAFTAGVHYSSGRWLVNGSNEGLVRLTLDPRVHARTLGYPLRVRELWLSLAEPDEFVARVAPPAQ